MKPAFAILFLALSLAVPAHAQLGGVSLPDLPGAVGDTVGQLPDVGETVEGAVSDPRALLERREDLTRDLIRENRRELEADPQGFAIARSQIIALDMSADAQARAVEAGFQIIRSDDLGELGAMVTIRAPANMPTSRALQRLREFDASGAYDFDHLHWQSGPLTPVVAAAQPSAIATGARIGLIDSGVGGSVVAQRAFVGPQPVVAPHGTAVAQLLATAAPGARIYAADIYGGTPTGGGSSALTRALAWLATERTPVINISLVGPRNAIVEATVARLVSRGYVIVAAVGNDGPAAAPLFPAAYPGVVGVTGVDARSRVLIEAGRGAHVDFSAPGQVSARMRGTSYAAPIVSGLLASGLSAPSAGGAEQAIGALRGQARDLGARGRDDIYGYGVVGAEIGAVAAR